MQDAETNWAFDIFGFADATPGYSLSLLFCHLVKQSGLVQELMIEEAKLVKYARRIEKGYDSANPYHNRSGFWAELPVPKLATKVANKVLKAHRT